MKSCYMLAPDGTESILEKELFKIFKNQKDADFFYSKLLGEGFKEKFGDWRERHKNIDKADVVKTGPTYLNGEPKIFPIKNTGQYYIELLDGTRFILNKRGLRGSFKPSEIKEVSKYFLFKYVEYGGIDSFNEMQSEDNQSKMMNIIEKGISDLRTHSKMLPEAARKEINRRLDKVELFKEEFRSQLSYELDSLGQKFKETEYDAEGNSTQEVTEEDKSGGVNRKESVTVNQKDTATVNTKIMLSQLVSKKLNKSNGKKETVRSKFLGTPVFEEFEVVWESLQRLLSDKATTAVGGKVSSAYGKMKGVIEDIKDIHPWAEDLNNKLEEMHSSGGNKKYKSFEFVQAFNKTLLKYYVTEFDRKTSKYNIFNATATNSRESQIMGYWSTGFSNIFLNNNQRSKLRNKDIEKISQVKEDVISIKKEFNDSIELAGEDRNLQVKAIEEAGVNLFSKLNEIGITNLNIEDINRLIYLGGGNQNERETINKLFSSVDYMIELDVLGKGKERLNFVDDDGNGRNPFKNQAGLKMLAKAVAMRETDISETDIIAGNGKRMFAYSNPTYISNKIAEWKSDETELQALANKTINKSSKWMHWLLANHITTNEKERLKLSRQRMDKFESVISSSFTSKGKDDSVDNVSITLEDQINDNLSKMLRGAFSSGGSVFPSIIAADKTRRIEFTGFEQINSRITRSKDGTLNIPPRTVGIFAKYFQGEYERMLEVAKEIGYLPDNQKVIHYHLGNKNGLKSQLFPELSHENIEGPLKSILYNEDGTPRNYEKSKTLSKDQMEKVTEHIRKSLEKRFEETRTEVEKVIDTTFVDSDLLSYYENNGGNTAMIGDYLVNGLVSTIEYTKLFSGDPAFYKNSTDLIKRIPATYTDGLQLSLEDNDDMIFNAAIINGVEVASKYKKLIQDSLSEEDKHIAKAYDKVNTTDAQAWITPRRWRFLKQRLGQWSDKHDDVFKKMYNGEVLEKDEMKLAAQPLKGVYFEINNGVPTYLKYSQAVIIPSMVQGGPMERLLDKMQGSYSVSSKGEVYFDKSAIKETHEVITIDGIKVGAMNPTTINKVVDGVGTTDLADSFELNTNTLSNKGWKLQQDLPIKTMHETNVGSQIQKNILDNLLINDSDKYKLSGMTEEQSGAVVLQKVHDAVSRLVEIGAGEISEQLGIKNSINGGVINNKDSLYDVLIKEFRERGGNENIIIALEKRTPFDAIPQIRGRVDSILMSVFSRAITKISTEGGSYIQVSPFGFEKVIEGDVEYNKKKLREERDEEISKASSPSEKNKIREEYKKLIENVSEDQSSSNIKIISDSYNKEGLLPPRKGPNKDTLPGQVMIPHTLAINLLRDAGYDMSKMTEKEIKEFFANPDTRELVGYRIPNQGMSSNDTLEIVGILPETMGDSIIGYDGIPGKTGSDFDIDKMYIMAPNLIFNKKDKKFEVINDENKKYYKGKKNVDKLVAQNNLLTLYSDILKSKHTYANMMTSIDSGYLREDIVKLHKKEKDKDLNLFSPITQLKIKKDYMDGKMGVALAANQLVDHVANQSLNIGVSEDLGQGSVNPLEGDYYGMIDMDKDVKGERRISHVLSAFLNAYVDIAKDNYITRGNHNDVTANVSFMLIRAGWSLERLNRFIGQPILKEYVELKARQKGITSKPLKFENDDRTYSPIEYLKKKYGFNKFEKQIEKPLDYIRETSNEELEKNILRNDEGKYYPLDELAQAVDGGDNIGRENDSPLDMLIQARNKKNNIDLYSLLAFEELEKKSAKWTAGVLAAKTEKGSGGSPIELHVKQNRIKKVQEQGFIENYMDKFDRTGAGAMKKYGFDFVSDVLRRSEIQLSATQGAKDVFDSIASKLTKENYLINVELGKAIDKGIYAYLMSGTDLMKGNRTDFKKLFVTLPERIIEMQKTSKNFLIKELQIETRGGYNFMGINSSNKPQLYENDIYWAWMDLYENPDTKSLAVDLVKYSYSQSGFSANLNQFFTRIPHEILRDEGINSDVNGFFAKINAIVTDTNFEEQFIRHEAENTNVVPMMHKGDFEVKPNDIVIGTEKFGEKFRATEDLGPKLLGKAKGKSLIKFPQFVSRRVEKRIELYKLVKVVSSGKKGRIKKPVYQKTFKLGFKAGKNRIFEYQYNENITESVVGWNKEVTPDLMDLSKYDEDFLNNAFGDNATPKFDAPPVNQYYSEGATDITDAQAQMIIDNFTESVTGETPENFIESVDEEVESVKKDNNCQQ